MPRPPRPTLVLAAAATLTLAGCTRQLAKEAGKGAAPGGLEGVLNTLAQPDSQQKLDQVAKSPGFQQLFYQAGQALGAGMVAGGFDAMFLPPNQVQPPSPPSTQPATSPSPDTLNAEPTPAPSTPVANTPDVQLFSIQDTAPPSTPPSTSPQPNLPSPPPYTPRATYDPNTPRIRLGQGAATAHDAARVIESDIAPAVASVVRQAVREGVREAFSDRTRDDAARLAADTGRAAATETSAALADALRKDLGPALRDTITRELAPALKQVAQDLSKDLTHTLATDATSAASTALASPELHTSATALAKDLAATTAREASRQSVLGLRDGLSESLEGRSVDTTSLSTTLHDTTRDLSHQAASLLKTLIWATALGGALLLLGILALGIWLGRVSARR